MIHPAQKSDAEDVTKLWNYYVETSTATFRSARYSVEEVIALIAKTHEDGHGFFTARNEKLLGFGLYRQFRSGDGYLYTMEHSLYLDKAAQGRGIGRKLMKELEAHAKQHQIHSFIGGVTTENEHSIEFHRQCGFRITSRIQDAGYKFEKWHDLTFMQKILAQ